MTPNAPRNSPFPPDRVKPFCLFLISCWCAVALHAGTPQPDAGGVTLDLPENGKIEVGTSLSVSFPSAMVGADKIDLGGESSPVNFSPALAGEWFWKSQTDGEFTVKAPITPGQTYLASLDPKLHDASGAAVAPQGWGAELKTEPFKVTTDWVEDTQLAAQPGVVLKFTYRVRLDDVARRIYFQDRDSGERREAELSLREEDRDDEPETSVLRATPREPLPIGRTWDLIVEDVREQTSGRPIPYLKRAPLGTTAPIELKWLAGLNQPLAPPLIRIHFDDTLNPETVNRECVGVEPPVADLKVRAEDEDIILDGSFDRTKHYQVTIHPTIKGQRGYGLQAPERWGATFRPKVSALFFPDPRVSERAGLGVRFSFLQVHTGALRWRIASVPLEKLAAVGKRLREFNAVKVNPFSGAAETDDSDLEIPQSTELLIDAFALETRAQGNLPASVGEEEKIQEVAVKTFNGKPTASGAYLLEVDGPCWDGKGTVGNRSLVFLSESVITEKRTSEAVLARVAEMSNGMPRPGITVRALSASNFEVARATTGADGVAHFTSAELAPPKGHHGGEPAQSFVADTPEGPAISPVDGYGFGDGVSIPDRSKNPLTGQQLRAVLLTDRSLYRPGQTAKIKGLARTVNADGSENGRLHVPAGETVHWSITPSESEEPVAQGDVSVDEQGGWETEWAIPANAKLGEYRLSCALLQPGDATQKKRGVDPDPGELNVTYLHIQDYKVPLFEVTAQAEAIAPSESAVSVCRVEANYFSGQPVVGARVSWRVHWNRSDHSEVPQAGASDDSSDAPSDQPLLTQDDLHSEGAVTNEELVPDSKGDARLNGKGEAVITAPLPPNLAGARYQARWEVAVTSADGQSVASSDSPTETLMRQPVLLGIATLAAEDDLDGFPPPKDLPPLSVRVLLAAYDATDQAARARDVSVELFRVGTKTVRETVAPFVVRYRNTPLYESMKTVSVNEVGPTSSLDFAVGEAGHYVVVAKAKGLRPVSTDVFVAGAGDDEVPVETPTSLEVIRSEKKEYAPGEKAVFLTRSPVSGVAWVSIETDRVVNTVLVPLPGSTSRIEVPVKPEYAPEATVAVYLLRPGGSDRLPAERFGSAQLRVRRPDRLLQVKPSLERPRVRPGEAVRGSVQVVSEGQPVPGADVTVWAVDDALLALGDWKAPKLGAAFYPGAPHQVKTYTALREYIQDVSRRSLYQKGFIVGGGGEEFGAKFVRKDFQPLAYWKTGLKTDADGRVPVEFNAPDNLTRYRLVAVAQTRVGQFGEGEGSLEIAKPLVVEPSLPRFLRAGDEVELRAVVRQSERDHASVSASCTTDDGLRLENTGAEPVAVGRDQPAVFRFRARVPDGPTSAKITFHAGTLPNDPESADAVEITLPILPPTILRHESMTGSVAAGGDVSGLLPEDARKAGAAGRYDLSVSTSADLPRLQAFSAVLEYPHGCFEQITSRVLAYCGVHELLAASPTDPKLSKRYRRIVEGALDRCASSLLPDDRLPYWPSQTDGNSFVTIQAAWAVRLAAAEGFTVDSDLTENLSRGVKKIAESTGNAATLRAFAMLVQATPDHADDLDADLARTLFLNRENLGEEGRALLAVALHRAGILPDETRQLLREILPFATGARPAPERAFDSETFGSTRRTEAMIVWACAELHPPEWKPVNAAAARDRMAALLDRGPLNSTQENLWALFAFHALRKADAAPKLRLTDVRPEPPRVSPDQTAAQWTGLPLGKDAALFIIPNGLAGAALHEVLTAEYRVSRAEEDTRRDRGGLRVERVVRNLTDPGRTGRSGEPPMRVNDRLLVTYRLQTPKLRAYVSLEDELPAGVEAVNPDLPLFAPFYDLPEPAPNERTVALSSSELRDNVTRAYFDRLDPGVSVYSVLARASAAGTFRWPATQAGPMYEPAVGGLAPSEQIVVVGE